MKKTLVYILVLVALMTALSGCGNTNNANPSPTVSPVVSPNVTDNSMMPGTDDGTVNDTDGIITDGDTGNNGLVDNNGNVTGGVTQNNNGNANDTTNRSRTTNR